MATALEREAQASATERRDFAAPDLEHLVLGALISDAEAWDAARDILRPDVFTGPGRPAIFETLAVFYRERIPVDEATVLAALDARQELRDTGVARELWASLAAKTTSIALVQHSAGVLRDLWAQRQARRLAAEFLNQGRVPSAEAAIDGLQRELAKIETGRGGRIVPAAELLVQLQDELEAENQARPGTEVVSTGFAGLDEIIGGFEPGIFQLYAARPGIGKSSLATAFSVALGRRGVPTAIFWLEDTPRKFALRLAASVGEIPARALRHGKWMHAPLWERLALASDEVSRWPLYVESTKGLTGAQLVQRMRRLKREKGVRVFLTDHLGEMQLERAEHGARTDLALGDVARTYRDEAERLGACPVAFHQLSQKAEVERGPRLGWLFNSDVLGQAGRVVVYLDVQGRTMKLLVTKATYGPPGATVELGWDPEMMRVFEPEPQQALPGAA